MGRARWMAALSIVAVLATACGGGDAETTSGSAEEGRGGTGLTTTSLDSAAEPPAPPAHAGAAAGDDAAGSGHHAAGIQEIVPVGRLVVRNAEITAEVTDPEAAAAALRDLAHRFGGFVAGADLTRDGGTFTLRVPAQDLDAAIAEISTIAREVRSTHIGTDDVTGEHADLSARLRNLRTYETELLALLSEVREREGATPEALLTVFERVRQVREEIERIEQRLSTLEDRVAMSTVTVHLEVPPVLTPDERPAWHPGEVLADAGRTTLRALQAIATGAIWVAVFALPIAAIVAAPFAVAFAIRRWTRRRAMPV